MLYIPLMANSEICCTHNVCHTWHTIVNCVTICYNVHTSALPIRAGVAAPPPLLPSPSPAESEFLNIHHHRAHHSDRFGIATSFEENQRGFHSEFVRCSLIIIIISTTLQHDDESGYSHGHGDNDSDDDHDHGEIDDDDDDNDDASHMNMRLAPAIRAKPSVTRNRISM